MVIIIVQVFFIQLEHKKALTIEKYVKIKSYVLMHSEDTKMLGFNQYRKSDKEAFIIYADLESLIIKIDECKNNPEESYTTKVSEKF